MNEPWKTKDWYVSAMNYQEEVTSPFSFAEKIQIHDVTLRDGEQQAGLCFQKDEKVHIGEKLAEAGVHRIEAGMPAVSKADADAITELAKRNLGPKIFCFSRCVKEDVDRAADCGVDGVIVEIPASEHIIQYAYGWSLEKAIDLSIQATAYAKEKGLYTVFFPIDGTRTDPDWFVDLIENVAAQGHMDALGAVDTFGVCSPHAIEYFVRRIKSRIDKPVEVHFHDDFGLGAANTLMGLAAGAEVAHTTISGIGERAGNAAMESVIFSLLTMYGIDVGIRIDKLYALSEMIREIADIALKPNQAIVGKSVFHIESGIVSDWLMKLGDTHPTEMYPFTWDLVGQPPPHVLLGKWSGRASIVYWLDKLNIEVPKDKIDPILFAVKEKGLALKRTLNQGEFEEIVEEIAG